MQTYSWTFAKHQAKHLLFSLWCVSGYNFILAGLHLLFQQSLTARARLTNDLCPPNRLAGRYLVCTGQKFHLSLHFSGIFINWCFTHCLKICTLEQMKKHRKCKMEKQMEKNGKFIVQSTGSRNVACSSLPHGRV